MTPMMQQYQALKAENEDCLLFFRLGDFYEMFFEDAKIAAQELDLVLTTRDRNKPEEQRTPMCGVPYHSSESYIARLIAKGHKIAICEQTEDPAQAKGLVKREVVRVVTPGTLTDVSMLEESKNNYIGAVYLENTGVGLCFTDVSTGQVHLSAFAHEDWLTSSIAEIERYAPRELLLLPEVCTQPMMDFLQTKPNMLLNVQEQNEFSARDAILFAPKLEKMPQALAPSLPAFGAVLSYLKRTQKSLLPQLNNFQYYTEQEYLELDPTARRNLELCETLRGKEKKGSLLWVLDRTRTPMGGRLLRHWLERPLRSPNAISDRLDAVAQLTKDTLLRDELMYTLKDMSDMERLITRISYGTAGARELLSLAQTLRRLPQLRTLLLPLKDSPLLQRLALDLDDLPQLNEHLCRAIVEEPPFSVREGGIIQAGYHPDVDKLRDILQNSRGIIAGIEQREKDKTGIKSLKINYNKVFGYYLEVSKSYYNLVPETYIRKQTLANCERYITQELKEMEHTILSAEDRLTALEFQLFTALREECSQYIAQVQQSAAAVASLDVLCAFATLASESHYCRPTVDDSEALSITDGRHPVVEKMLQESLFVPNDTHMDTDAHCATILTGPNMAGKSTYMRQVALIVLMAQIGSFVPAKEAQIGVVDRIFTRIGASDDLAGGQSTFMVEMSEVSEILHHATRKSLLILDEIGRGTSTYDGMAIARAVLEACADKENLGAKTLFATHYHELTALEDELEGVSNFYIAAKKREGKISFLRKILPGKAQQSYGLEVAALAGIPDPVIERGRALLAELEANHQHLHPSTQTPLVPPVPLLEPQETETLKRLRTLPVDSLTPLDALTLLYELKRTLLSESVSQ